VAWERVAPDGAVEITRSKSVADGWSPAENFVRPLYAHPAPQEAGDVKVTDAMVEAAWHGGRMAIGKPWVTPTEADLIGVRAALEAALSTLTEGSSR